MVIACETEQTEVGIDKILEMRKYFLRPGNTYLLR